MILSARTTTAPTGTSSALNAFSANRRASRIKVVSFSMLITHETKHAFAISVRSTSTLARVPSSLTVPRTHTSMKKLFSLIVISSLALMATVQADEQETVDHCTNVIRDFRHMPEKAI